MRFVFCLFLVALSTSLVCQDNQHKISVDKRSGNGGDLETYTISGSFSGESRTLVTGVAVPAGANLTQEYCLDATTDGVYSIELKHTSNGLWSAGSFVTVMNVDGIVVYSGSLTSSTKVFQFTLTYLINPGGSVYNFQSYDTREWWQRDYVMDSNWVLVSSTASAYSVYGTNLNRVSFDIPNLEKYSHIVIRLYYRYGIILFVNGVRYYIDNMSLTFSETNYPMTIMEMASSSYSQYVWKEVIIPSSLLYSTNNVMIISVHYDEYDEYQQLMTYSVLGVYASIPDTQCSPLPVQVSLSNGVKEDSNADHIFDHDLNTQTVFKAATMHVTVDTPIPAIVSEYTLHRFGDDSIESWKLMNCGAYSNGLCTQWRTSSSRQESRKNNGTYYYHCDETTNLLSASHRFQFFTLDGAIKDTSLNEATLYVCGMTVDLTMYSHQVVEFNEAGELNLTPEYPVEGATYSIYPALPSSAQINTATGAITGTSTGFDKYNAYTVIKNNAGVKTKFYLTIITNNAESTEAPTEAPTVAPTEAPVEPTVEPTEAPDNGNAVMITIIVVVVIVIVVVVVIVISCKSKKTKTGPAKTLPVVLHLC